GRLALAQGSIEQRGQPYTGERQPFIHQLDVRLIVNFINGYRPGIDQMPRLLMRFVGPVDGGSSGLLLQMLLCDQLVQAADVIFRRKSGVLEQEAVQGQMEIAIVVAALGRAEGRQLDIVAATGFFHRMQRLMQVADKVHKPLERLQTALTRGVAVTKNLLENLDAIDYAVVVVRVGVLVLVLRTEAVTRLGEARRVLRDINIVPARALVAVFSHLVSPGGDGSQSVISQKKLQVGAGGGSQARLREIGNDGVPFRPPGRKLSGNETCQEQQGDDFP